MNLQFKSYWQSKIDVLVVGVFIWNQSWWIMTIKEGSAIYSSQNVSHLLFHKVSVNLNRWVWWVKVSMKTKLHTPHSILIQTRSTQDNLHH